MQAHLGPRQEKKNVCLPLLLRKMTPRGHKSCYGLFRSVDCSKIPDNTHTKCHTFGTRVIEFTRNPPSDVRTRSRNRPDVVELVG